MSVSVEQDFLTKRPLEEIPKPYGVTRLMALGCAALVEDW